MPQSKKLILARTFKEVEEAIERNELNEKERRFNLHEVNLKSAPSYTIKTPTDGASIEEPARPVCGILTKLYS